LTYFQYNVNTSIRVKSLSQMEFPVVTICNTAMFTTEFGLNYTRKMFERLKPANYPQTKQGFNHHFFVNNTDFDYYLRASVYELESDEARHNLGLDLDRFVVMCSFAHTECKRYEFVKMYDLQKGLCYRFNSGKDQNDNKIPTRIIEKLDIGLNILLYSTDLNEEDLYFNNGFNIFISFDKNQIHLSGDIKILPAYRTRLKLQKSILTMQPKPYSNCSSDLDTSTSFDRKIYEIMKNLSINFNTDNCKMFFFQYEVEQTCKCYDLTFLPLSKNYGSCTTNSQVDCLDSVFRRFFVIKNQTLNEIRDSYCPIDCEKEILDLNLSMEQISLGYVKLLKETLFVNSTKSIEHIRKNIAWVDIEYKSMTQTEIEESISMTLLDLISDCGGNFFLLLKGFI
jgi:hypothetical protein